MIKELTATLDPIQLSQGGITVEPSAGTTTVFHHQNTTFKALPSGCVIKIGPDNKPRNFITQNDPIVGISITFNNQIMLDTIRGRCQTIKVYNLYTGRSEGTIKISQ